MASNILSVGTTAANSADVVVSSSGLTVGLKDASGPTVLGFDARVDILLKDDAGQYFRVDALTPAKPAIFIQAPGTYRFSRRAGPACGVFSA